MPRAAPVLLAALLGFAAAGCASAPPLAEGPARDVRASGRFVTHDGVGRDLGAYGLRVALAARHARGGRWRALSPAPATTDESGAFAFAFSTRLDLSAYDSLAAFALGEGVAVRFSPRGAVRLRPASGGPSPGDAFPHGARVALAASGARGPVEAEALGGTLPPEVGTTARYAALGRDLAFEIYGGSPPFALPPVRVRLGEGGGFRFQPFDPSRVGGTEIELNRTRRITADIVAHEYGHYVSYRMWGSAWWRYVLRAKRLREGWALFYSFATRAYAAEAHGDVYLRASNMERAPFTHLIGDLRYEQTSYGRSHPEYVAVGALLWSLYDGAGRSPFEPDGHGLAGDNDDVSGQAVRVAEAVRLTRASVTDAVGIAEVLTTFRAAAPASLGPSIDGAAAFFLCPAAPDCNPKAPPDARPETASATLRPAAPLALTAVRDGAAVRLAWEPATPRAFWGNPPEGYLVLRDGEPLATLGPDATTATDPDARGAHVYAVHSLGGGGASATAPTARVAAPTVAPPEASGGGR